MRIHNIIPDIYYVGVNDRVTDRFEGLWPIPYGVSYNSYLVSGSEGAALIDTVEIGYANQLVEHIRSNPEVYPCLKYLVVNHMEPDHSGSIPVILDAFPEMKVLGNRQTLAMIKGFYHGVEEERLVEVKDGETVSLGSLTLTFYLTPMVHWPETMMTYVAERKALFTGDALGCFGALDGGVLDETLQTERYFGEMYRYYACIVGKYGRFVQNAFKKIAPLEIEYACTTHGPVWHRDLGKVIEVYDRLSKGEWEDGCTVIYGSMYGNTEQMAEAIADRLGSLGVCPVRVHNASKSPMADMISDAFRYKGLIVGSPTYSMTIFPPVETLMRAMETREVKGKVFASFGSFTWASGARDRINEIAERMGMEVVDSLTMKHAATAEDFRRGEELAEKVAECLKGSC